jgi:Subtilase family.
VDDATGRPTVNVVPGEILQPGSLIELRAAHPIHPRWAQGAVRLIHGGSSQRVTVTLAARGRALRIATGRLEPGGYELVVSELLGTRGERLVDRLVVPFSIVPISGRVPPDVRVEHAVRLAIGELDVERLAPGQRSEAGHVDVVKAVGRKDGEPVELAFDQDGATVDIHALLHGVSRARFRKFGRLDEALWTRIEAARDDQPVDIVIWPRLDLSPAPYVKPSDKRLEAPAKGEREVTDVVHRARVQLRALLQRSGIALHPADDTDANDVPFVRATATVGQVRELARSDIAGVISLDDTTEIPDLGNSIAIARSDLAHTAGFDGTGVRVAVWETGPSVTTNLTFANRFTAMPGASDHARLTSAVVKNTEAGKPHGHAPDCDLYSANASGVDALRWAVRDQHCTVISQSFHRSTEPGGAGLQSDDLLKDWLALRWPYPTILQAAGNYWLGDADGISPPEDEFVNHKGFNSLAVGSHDDSAGAMAGDSVFRNPSSTHGDRELPEIAANGTGVSANTETMSGTSFAAPAVAGVTALLQDVDGVLCSWPEGCRAILLASAGRNVSRGTWWHDVVARTDGADGAGAVDAQAGVLIAQQRRWRDAPATRRGWDVGTLASSVVGADRLATFRHRVSVPGSVWFPTVKVALAWDSAITSSGETATASTLTVDLDLIVRDSHGVQVAVAASWDNSYEVVEFAATPGETYEIVIRRWSGTDSVWFGVAWTVTGFTLPWPWGSSPFTELSS